MDKIELIAVLKELAAKFQSGLFCKVRERLSPREANLLDYVFEHYYRKDEISGRWYDPYHVLFSASFAVQLVNSLLVVPAAILHDIGYCLAGDKLNWDAPSSRITHMQEGAALSAEILIAVGGYSSYEIGKIVGMVVSHDNPYLGIPITDSDRLVLRDADRIWVMHFISFWKDFVSETGHAKDLSPSELLRLRQRQFYENIVPHTRLAKQWRDGQFKKRLKEVEDSIIEDKDIFQKRAEKAIKSKTG